MPKKVSPRGKIHPAEAAGNQKIEAPSDAVDGHKQQQHQGGDCKIDQAAARRNEAVSVRVNASRNVSSL